MGAYPIKIADSIIRVQGSIFYNDKRRRIDLKRPICDLLSEETVRYSMELCLSKEAVIKRIEELVREGVVPVLLYFNKGDCDELH